MPSISASTVTGVMKGEQVWIDAYDVLGVQLNADAEAIKKAFRKRSLETHPDKNAGNSEQFQEVKLAYDILQDESRRKVYDKIGLDVGDQTPEQLMWALGGEVVAVPAGYFLLKVCTLSIFWWTISWSYVDKLIFIALCGLGFWGFQQTKTFASPEDEKHQLGQIVLLYAIIFTAILVLSWISDVLTAASIMGLIAADTLGKHLLAVDLKYLAGVGIPVLLFFSWLFQERWWTVLGFLFLLFFIIGVSILGSGLLVHLWFEI